MLKTSFLKFFVCFAFVLLLFVILPLASDRFLKCYRANNYYDIMREGKTLESLHQINSLHFSLFPFILVSCITLIQFLTSPTTMILTSKSYLL